MDTIGKIHSSQLDEYVRRCDEKGGIYAPACKEFVSDFELTIDSKVNRALDPFSDAYFAQQLAVYRELSGRMLNQKENELHPFVFENHLNGVNPYNSTDAVTMGHHVAATALTLKLANVPANPKVLDMGVGLGLSSETLAYCGAQVTAVDINPDFVELIQQRVRRKGGSIVARLSNFDDYDDVEGTYDLIIFVSSLHHAPRPWDVLAKVSRFLKADGKIALVMEPIQKSWWPYWGLRLDSESAYVARKYGWFESGWSEEFVRLAFNRIGFDLQISHYNPELFAGGFFCLGMKADAVASSEFPFIPRIARGEKLTFCQGGAGRSYLSFGWSESEGWGTWSDGHQAGLLLNLPEGNQWRLNLEVYPMVSDILPTQVVVPTIDDRSFGPIVINAEKGSATMEKTSTFQIDVSRAHVGNQSGLVELRLDLPTAARPGQIGRGSDPRRIALGIVSLTIT